MRDDTAVAALVERVVAGARIPSRARRADLRRELWTHFEDAGASPDGVHDAIRRFGGETAIIESLREVHRWDYVRAYLAKVAASIVVCLAAALLIQLVVNVRVQLGVDLWRLAPGFPRGARVAVAVVLGVIAAWEIARPPFNRARAAAAILAYAAVSLIVRLSLAWSAQAFVTAAILVAVGYACARFVWKPVHLLVLCGAFAAALYLDHLALAVVLAPTRALLGGAVLAATWSSTVIILTRVDRAFVGLFDHTIRQPA